MTVINQLKCLTSEIEAQYSSEKLLSGLMEMYSELIPEAEKSIDLENFISAFLFIPAARHIKDDESILEILLHTAKKNNIEITEKIVLNHLLILCDYDKIIDVDKPYFFLLDQFFNHINLTFANLSLWNELYYLHDTVFKGVALSKSKTPKQILQSRLKDVNNNLKLFPQNVELLLLKEIIEQFIASPCEINTILFSTYLMNFENFSDLNPEKLKALDGIKKLINSASPVEKHHLYNSMKYLIKTLFSKNDYWQKALIIDKQLSNENLAEIIDLVMQYTFYIESNTSPNEMDRTVQIRTYFFDFPIYELQTLSNHKQHPVLKDEDLLYELLEKLQRKFPLKSPVHAFSELI